jgi:hypothetical protein
MIGSKFHLVSFTINSDLSSYNSYFYNVPVLQYCILFTHLWHWLENITRKTMQDGLNCFFSLWVGQLIEYTNLSIFFSPSFLIPDASNYTQILTAFLTHLSLVSCHYQYIKSPVTNTLKFLAYFSILYIYIYIQLIHVSPLCLIHHFSVLTTLIYVGWGIDVKLFQA